VIYVNDIKRLIFVFSINSTLFGKKNNLILCFLLKGLVKLVEVGDIWKTI